MSKQQVDGTFDSGGQPVDLVRLHRVGVEAEYKRKQAELQAKIQAERDKGTTTVDDRVSLDGGRFEDDMTRVKKYDGGIWYPPD